MQLESALLEEESNCCDKPDICKKCGLCFHCDHEQGGACPTDYDPQHGNFRY